MYFLLGGRRASAEEVAAQYGPRMQWGKSLDVLQAC